MKLLKKISKEISYLFDYNIMWPLSKLGNMQEDFGKYMRELYPEKFEKEINYLNSKKENNNESN